MAKNIDSSKLQAQQYLQLFGSIGSQALGNDVMSIAGQGLNSVWNLSSDDPNTVAQGVQGATNFILSIFSAIASNAEASAEKDVEETNKRIYDANEKIDEIKKASNSKVQEIIDKIAAEANKVQTSIEKITELVGERGDVQAKQKELDEQKKELEKQKEILNDPNASLKEKTDALAEVSKISKAIGALALAVTELLKTVEAETENVNAAEQAIDGYTTEAESTVTKMLEDAGATVTQTTSETAMSISRQTAEGKTEEIKGQAFQAAAAEIAAGTLGIGSATSAEFEAKAIDQFGASAVHIAGSAKNMSKLGDAIGKWGGDFTSIGADMQLLGVAESGALALIGSYKVQEALVRTTIGSWASVTEGKEELDQAVDSFAKELNIVNTPESSTKDNENQTGFTHFGMSFNINKIQTRQRTNPQTNQQETILTTDAKFEFDTDKLSPKLDIKK